MTPILTILTILTLAVVGHASDAPERFLEVSIQFGGKETAYELELATSRNVYNDCAIELKATPFKFEFQCRKLAVSEENSEEEDPSKIVASKDWSKNLRNMHCNKGGVRVENGKVQLVQGIRAGQPSVEYKEKMQYVGSEIICPYDEAKVTMKVEKLGPKGRVSFTPVEDPRMSLVITLGSRVSDEDRFLPIPVATMMDNSALDVSVGRRNPGFVVTYDYRPSTLLLPASRMVCGVTVEKVHESWGGGFFCAPLFARMQCNPRDQGIAVDATGKLSFRKKLSPGTSGLVICAGEGVTMTTSRLSRGLNQDVVFKTIDNRWALKIRMGKRDLPIEYIPPKTATHQSKSQWFAR